MSSETPPLTNAASTSNSAQNLIEELLGPVSDDGSSNSSGSDRPRGDSDPGGIDIEKVDTHLSL